MTSSLLLTAVNVRDDDRGCNKPERLVDLTCGDGQGDLSDALVISLETAPGIRPAIRWSGTLHQLEHGVPLAQVVPAHRSIPVSVTLRLPPESGNETQTDRVSFDLRVTLSGLMGDRSTEVAGTKFERDQPGDDPAGPADSDAGPARPDKGVAVAGVKLAATGAASLPGLLALGGLAVATGAFLVARGRRSPH